MRFDILNRWTNAVQFTAEIECDESIPASIKIGLAVKWAIETKASLSGANLSDAYLSGANLSGAYLRDAYLSGANLSGAYLRGADLSDANLSDAYLSGANLSGAYLRGADLSDANLSDAYLSGANLSGAYLRGANLSDAYLSGAYLRGAYLRGANLRDAGNRSDGYEFYFHMKDGELWVKAGCRHFSITDARKHWTSTRGGTSLGEESLALCDHAERMARILGWLPKSAPADEPADLVMGR